jgi:hypothetical protein
MSGEDSENQLPVASLESIARRALTFQRYVLRRAWGTYYAVWAAAFAAFVFGGQIPFQDLLLPGSFSWVPYAAFYGTIGLVAGISTALIFANARRTIFLQRHVQEESRFGLQRYALMWLWWLGFYVAVFLAFTLFPQSALSILYAMLFTVEVFIYYTVRVSFQDRFPLEAKLALFSYGLAVTFSFVASLFTSSVALFGVAWSIAIAIWVFCALYALRQAPEELVALVY